MVSLSEYMRRLPEKIEPNEFPEATYPYPKDRWFRCGEYFAYMHSDWGIIFRISDLRLIFVKAPDEIPGEIPGDLADISLKALGGFLLGDANRDGCVDIKDLIILGKSYRSVEGDSHYDARADFNDDGVIDIKDLIIMGKNWRRCI